MNTMKALVYQGPETLAVLERPVPQPAAGQALIRIGYAGVCGSDISIVLGKHPRAKAPLVLGHEFVGEIAALGAGVQGFAPGDRVVADPLISCGRCWACTHGAEHVCRSLRLYGIDTDGGMAQYAAVDAGTLYKLPAELDDRTAALIEPVAVAVHSLQMGGTQPGDTAVVTGAGPIGLLMALVLRESGVRVLFMTELDEFRTGVARELGFAVANPVQEDVVRKVLEATGGEGADCLYEASGAAPAALMMTDTVRSRGTLVMLAVPKQPHPVNLRDINFKEITLVGTRVYCRDNFARAVDFTLRHRNTLSRLISHVMPLTQGPRAIEQFHGKDRTLKVLIDCR